MHAERHASIYAFKRGGTHGHAPRRVWMQGMCVVSCRWTTVGLGTARGFAAGSTVGKGLREVGGQPMATTLASYLQAKQLVLMLDNFEQVVGAATAVAKLLQSWPGLKV